MSNLLLDLNRRRGLSNSKHLVESDVGVHKEFGDLA